MPHGAMVTRGSTEPALLSCEASRGRKRAAVGDSVEARAVVEDPLRGRGLVELPDASAVLLSLPLGTPRSVGSGSNCRRSLRSFRRAHQHSIPTLLPNCCVASRVYLVSSPLCRALQVLQRSFTSSREAAIVSFPPGRIVRDSDYVSGARPQRHPRTKRSRRSLAS